jgi:hypothetical protein
MVSLADEIIVVALGLERADRSTENAALRLREIATKVAALEDREQKRMSHEAVQEIHGPEAEE